MDALTEIPTAETVYEEHVRPLPPQERLRLLALTAKALAEDTGEAPPARPRRSIMDLHGLGKEIWEGIDPQEYVNELRAEWDHRP